MSSRDQERGTEASSLSSHTQFEQDVQRVKEDNHDAITDPEKREAPSAPIVNEDIAPREMHGIKWVLVCVSLYIGAFLYGLDTTIAADVQAAVVERFGSVEKLSWIGTGYPLGSVAVILAYGAGYNNFDMKWLFIISFTIFELGSVLCGAAPTMDTLIVGRVVCGLGGSGIYMGALNILSVQTNKQERGPYIAGFGTVWGVGSILGPVVGGAFSTSSATWRWAFYINLVVAAVCAPVYVFYLPSIHPNPGKTIKQKLALIDWTGIILSAGIVTAFTLVFTFAGAAWPWKDARTIVVFIVLGILLVAFAAQQKLCIFTTREQRTFPAHLLHSRTQILLYIGTSCAVTNLFVPTYYIPVYFQFVNNDSAIKAAVRLLPFICLLVSTNMLSGFILPRIKYYMPLYTVSGVLMTIGGALMYTVNSHTPAAHIYGYSILLAVGSGLTIQAGYSVATVKVADKGHEEDIQNAVSLQNVSQVGSTLIALVISGQVFQSLAFKGLKEALAGRNFSDSEIRGAIAGTQSIVFEGIDSQLRQKAIDAITKAMDNVYILSLTAGALSIVISPLMKREKLFGKQTSSEA